MEEKVCLDTDILVNFLRNKKEETTFILENEDRILFSTTIINIFELYYGAFKSKFKDNIEKVEELLGRMEILNLSQESAKKAGEMLAFLEKNGTTIDFRDLLIGAIAVSEGVVLKTNNKKHFEKIPEIRLR